MSRAFIQKRLPFKPTDIGGCSLWLDSIDPSTISFSSASNISQWRDKSGFLNHFTPTSGTPTLTSDNGKTVVNFTSGVVMGSANQITFTTSSAFFIVSRLTSSGFNMLLAFPNIANGGGSSGDFSIRFDQGGLYGTAAKAGNGQDFANGTYYVNGTFNPSFGTNVYLNVYSIIATVSPQAGGTSSVTLSSGFMGRNFIGNIAEFIYYHSGVTSIQRQQIESYLAQKWGLQTSLPQGHPGTRGIVYPSDPVNLLVRLPYPSAFVPTTAGNCQLWLDAADSTTLTGTSPVTQWRDKSGNARNTTSYAGTPALTTNAINSVQAINFNGSSSFTGSIPGSGTSYTVFFVGTFNNSTGTYGGFVCFGRSGTPDHVSGITNTKLTDSSMYSTIDSTNTAFTSNTLSTPFVYSLVIDGTFLNNFVNGNQQTPANVAKLASFNFTNYVVANRAGSTSSIFLNGYVGEIIVYLNGLATLQRQQVEGYLAWKWGLQANLPANHPYKNASPNITNQFGISRPPNVLPIPPITISARTKYVPTLQTITFTYTGSNQTFTVPSTISPASVTLYIWGAGGGGNTNYGGAGAMVQGILPVTSGETLTIVVGQGGTIDGSTTYGGGGAGAGNMAGGSAPGIGYSGNGFPQNAGSGGGRSAIQRGGTDPTNDIVVAGGGGGGTYFSSDRGGAATFSGTANSGTGGLPGLGGTQTAGGAGGGTGFYGQGLGGSRGIGGNTYNTNIYNGGGGGGGGYYGGGAGGTNGGDGAGGGGGSSLTGGLSLISGQSVLGFNSTNGFTAPNTASSYYQSGVGNGAPSISSNPRAGGNGLIVLTYFS